MFGAHYQVYMTGDNNMFHLLQPEYLKTAIREETGIEDQTWPGQLEPMIKTALTTFKNRPVVLTHDERAVS